MENTPNWISVLAALLTPTIAIFGSYIAWQQHSLNKRKYKIELYPKRVKVMKAIADVFGRLIMKKSISIELITKLMYNTMEAHAIFNTEITDLMKLIATKLIKLLEIQNLLINVESTEQKEKELIKKKKDEQIVKIMNDFDNLNNLFQRIIESYKK